MTISSIINVQFFLWKGRKVMCYSPVNDLIFADLILYHKFFENFLVIALKYLDFDFDRY